MNANLRWHGTLALLLTACFLLGGCTFYPFGRNQPKSVEQSMRDQASAGTQLQGTLLLG